MGEINTNLSSSTEKNEGTSATLVSPPKITESMFSFGGHRLASFLIVIAMSSPTVLLIVTGLGPIWVNLFAYSLYAIIVQLFVVLAMIVLNILRVARGKNRVFLGGGYGDERMAFMKARNAPRDTSID